ncbi:lateral signaling target protein 2 homolog isoform X1 [Colletes gigas]|uniref:lateral signaling target protein 2 homolog isoform X1 n=1 Tax=Colletes gigas TaxID=935657 RepID=UPI001C9B0820|nr:lateral signaling target protein 2 homolog isoform X1 [Colletes gigas]
MTVTPSTSDVADKAVSTDDGGSGMEVVRLEAVLAALVETKVEAIKASSLGKRSGSAPTSPRQLRLTSTSTASSSLNHHHQHRRKSHHHHHHYHHYHHHHQHHRKRHDSAPCDAFIEDDTEHHRHNSHHGKARRKASESPRRPKKKRKHSKSPNILHDVVQDVQTGLNSRFELFGTDGDQDLTLINFERTRETLSDSCEYPQLHRSACYFPQSTAQLKIHYDNDDNYVALNVADELEEEEILSGIEKVEEPREKYHRPRKKRKRKRHKVNNTGPREELVDPEELPPRARWTIVATACLLLAMSLLLVGVTLRMAPIIDDMGNGRRNSLSRTTRPRRASTSRRRDSVQPIKTEIKEVEKVAESVQDLEEARRHRRITVIILGTFLFLLVAAVLAVVVTLTHSTFSRSAVGSKEHRLSLRKENEELLNSLNRDFTVENTTMPP